MTVSRKETRAGKKRIREENKMPILFFVQQKERFLIGLTDSGKTEPFPENRLLDYDVASD